MSPGPQALRIAQQRRLFRRDACVGVCVCVRAVGVFVDPLVSVSNVVVQWLDNVAARVHQLS